ncbi:hypothetical protein P9112_008385 [Eukaryota sp. TZLM1-RC]
MSSDESEATDLLTSLSVRPPPAFFHAEGSDHCTDVVIGEVIEELGFEVTLEMITSHGTTPSARKKKGRTEIITVHYFSVCLNPTADSTDSIDRSKAIEPLTLTLRIQW